MPVIETNCKTSSHLFAGDTFLHDACIVEIISIIDTSHVSVKVYPLYEGRVDVILTEDQQTNFRDFQVPFRITATTIFTGTTSRVCVLKVCNLEEVSEPEPETCVQQFEIHDQNANPLNGMISCPDWDTDLPVPNTGTASMTLQKGKTYIVTAHREGITQVRPITPCTSYPVTFTFDVAPVEPSVLDQVVDYVSGLLPGMTKTAIKTALGVFGLTDLTMYLIYKSGAVATWVTEQMPGDPDPEPEPPIDIPEMEDISDRPQDNLKIIDSSHPDEVEYNESFVSTVTVESVYGGTKSIARIYKRTTGEFITEQKFTFPLFGEKIHVFEFPGYMYTVNHLQFRVVILLDRLWPLSNIVQDGLDFTVEYKDYIDPNDPSLEFCLQEFQVLYGGVPVPATVTVGGVDVPVSVEGGSITLQKGKEYTAVARHKGGSETKIFTACSLEPLVFGIPLPPIDEVDEDEDDDKTDYDLLLYAAVFIAAFIMFSKRS